MKGTTEKESETTTEILIRIAGLDLTTETQFESVDSLSPRGQQALKQIIEAPINPRSEAARLSSEEINAEIALIRQDLEVERLKLRGCYAQHAAKTYATYRCLID